MISVPISPYRLRAFFSLLAIEFAMLTSAQIAQSQTIKTKDEISRVVIVENIKVANGVVSGEAVNRSANTLRDLQLFIRYTWLWDDEMKPGKIDPGTSTYHTLSKDIPPAGRLPFTFSPSPPLPKVSGGRFETSVSVAAFAEVIEPKQ